MERVWIFDAACPGDRYTVIDRKPHNGSLVYLGMNAEPSHPQGIGMHGEIPSANGRRLARLSDLRHLGKRIKLADLPPDARRAAERFIADVTKEQG